VQSYDAPGHFKVMTQRLSGKDETGATKFWIGYSEFEPGGGADWAYEDNPLEKVYYVLEGELTIKSKTEEFILRANDLMFFPPNEGREIINNTDKKVKMLVAINYPS